MSENSVCKISRTKEGYFKLSIHRFKENNDELIVDIDELERIKNIINGYYEKNNSDLPDEVIHFLRYLQKDLIARSKDGIVPVGNGVWNQLRELSMKYDLKINYEEKEVSHGESS